MANEKGKNRIALLGKLTFAPEARGEDTPRPLIQGRFKYFSAIFKKYNNLLMTANLFFLIFCLPLLVVLIIPSALGGMENVSYILAGTKKLPYFMSDFGIGLSAGQSILQGKLAILKAYQLYFLCIAAAIPFMSPGLAGLFHVAIKLIWQQPFVTKKDSYGNNVPRISVEFFIGLRKYWLPMLIITAVFAAVFAGVSSSFVYFIGSFWRGSAGAGQWILIIVAVFAALIAMMLLVYMLPMVPMYELPLAVKLKNSALLITSMFVPSFFVAAVSALPFVLIVATGGIFRIILIAAVLIFGGSILSLMWTNFIQYHAEKIITPVYEAQRNKAAKKQKKPQSGSKKH